MKREPTQLFFPGGRGNRTSWSPWPLSVPAVKWAHLVLTLLCTAGRGLQGGRKEHITSTKEVWTLGSAAPPFPHTRTTSVYGPRPLPHLPWSPLQLAIILNIY